MTASILEYRDDNQEGEQVADHDQHWSPIVATHTHSHRNGNEKIDSCGDAQRYFYNFVPERKLTSVRLDELRGLVECLGNIL